MVPEFLAVVASLVVDGAQAPGYAGSVAVGHGLSCSMTRGYFGDHGHTLSWHHFLGYL